MFTDIIFGLKVALIGMGVTFVGLVALIGLVHLNRIIAESINKVPGKKTAEEVSVKKEAPKPQEKAPAPAAVKNTALKADNGSVVAAITAAVSVMMDGAPFKLKSVKKAQASSNTNAWDMVAIQEQNNNL